jgi:hypothetical protein
MFANQPSADGMLQTALAQTINAQRTQRMQNVHKQQMLNFVFGMGVLASNATVLIQLD